MREVVAVETMGHAEKRTWLSLAPSTHCATAVSIFCTHGTPGRGLESNERMNLEWMPGKATRVVYASCWCFRASFQDVPRVCRKTWRGVPHMLTDVALGLLN